MRQKERTTNERFIKLLIQRGLDTRADKIRNKDASHIAGILGVSNSTIVNWLSPQHWKSHRRMPLGYLKHLEELARE